MRMQLETKLLHVVILIVLLVRTMGIMGMINCLYYYHQDKVKSLFLSGYDIKRLIQQTDTDTVK